ncbi:MAG: S41 family peptidase [Gammaproteobacteria bacterium]|nr:S41 family peptidase [Gammaproteobacteria bacterium]MDE0364040.1 S41 family peptidase [Gammaproteobacteria bacterium]
MGLRFVTLFGIVASIVTGIALGILGYRGWFDGVKSSRQADVIEQAATYIRANYVDEIEDGQLVADALRGMLNGLDGYSKYLDRDAYERLQADTAGRFGGIGIELGLRDGYFTVVETLENAPAARAGMAAGDRLIALDGESLKGKKLLDVIELIRGPRGSDVNLTLIRSGGRFEVGLTRARIDIESVRARWLEPGYAYVRISRFQKDTGNEFADTVRALGRESDIGIAGLVLDLRNNPGGVLGASVDTADVFLEPGLLICTESRPGIQRLEHRALTGDLLNGAPSAVLINEGSASGSEIVASALQDHGRATVLGLKSYGKGSVQSVLPLAGERALKLTTGYYYRPGGGSLHASGVVPEVRMDSTDDGAWVERALQIVKGEVLALR